MKTIHQKVLDFLTIVPVIIIFGAGIIYSLVYNVRISLLDKNEVNWVGISNYIKIFEDTQFWNSLWFTSRYLIFVTIVEMIIGICLALLVYSKLVKGKNFWRGAIIAPMLVIPVVTGVVWRLMLHPSVGIVNYFLSFFRIPPIEWLSRPLPAFFAVSIMDIWQWTPFIFLIIYSVLETIPDEIIEAAKIDGASGYRIFRYMILPWIKNTIIFAFAIRGLEVFKIFDHIYSSTNGGPGFSTEHISLYLYRIGFKFSKFNYASAGSLFFIMMVLFLWTFLYIRFVRKRIEI